jgi:hypothetical protein
MWTALRGKQNDILTTIMLFEYTFDSHIQAAK